MLQSYEAIYDHGQIRWLADKPTVDNVHVIVTMLSPQAHAGTEHTRVPSARIAGKGRILGEIVAPAVPDDEWEVLR